LIYLLVCKIAKHAEICILMNDLLHYEWYEVCQQ